MKAFQKILSMIAALLLCLGVCVPAFADEMDSSPEEDWDQVNAAVLSAYGVSPDSVRAGYRNLVTGEEHYLNGDEYTVAASMFKVPLCMACTEKLQNGDVDWSVYEQYFSYKDVQDQVLIESSKPAFSRTSSLAETTTNSELKPRPIWGSSRDRSAWKTPCITNTPPASSSIA